MTATAKNILMIEDSKGKIFIIEKPFTGIYDNSGKKIFLGDTLETLDQNDKNTITYDDGFYWGRDSLNDDCGSLLRKIN